LGNIKKMKNLQYIIVLLFIVSCSGKEKPGIHEGTESLSDLRLTKSDLLDSLEDELDAHFHIIKKVDTNQAVIDSTFKTIWRIDDQSDRFITFIEGAKLKIEGKTRLETSDGFYKKNYPIEVQKLITGFEEQGINVWPFERFNEVEYNPFENKPKDVQLILIDQILTIVKSHKALNQVKVLSRSSGITWKLTNIDTTYNEDSTMSVKRGRMIILK
jgi:hypothetical protein